MGRCFYDVELRPSRGRGQPAPLEPGGSLFVQVTAAADEHLDPGDVEIPLAGAEPGIVTISKDEDLVYVVSGHSAELTVTPYAPGVFRVTRK